MIFNDIRKAPLGALFYVTTCLTLNQQKNAKLIC